MRSSGTTFSKRQRERAKREKKREKAQKREQRKVEKDDSPEAVASDVDPDIAHIVPGPQPIPEEEMEELAAATKQLEE